MKTASDPRHKKREKQIRQLYTYSLSSKQAGNDVSKIIDNLKTIDKLIAKSAPEWPLDQINKIDLAILRLATFEIIHQPKIPQKVSVDEAVELAKSYGSDSTPGFVNGVLGSIIKKEKRPSAKSK